MHIVCFWVQVWVWLCVHARAYLLACTCVCMQSCLFEASCSGSSEVAPSLSLSLFFSLLALSLQNTHTKTCTHIHWLNRWCLLEGLTGLPAYVRASGLTACTGKCSSQWTSCLLVLVGVVNVFNPLSACFCMHPTCGLPLMSMC
jgi:hypothetical protein